VKELIILAGPNGAGKTTAARVLLPDFIGVHEFLNADEIARNLSPENVEAAALAAGRKMIERTRGLVQQGASFGLETTCAGKSYIRLLQECKQAGWRLSLIFLWLKSPELAVQRVAQRVNGGATLFPARPLVADTSPVSQICESSISP